MPRNRCSWCPTIWSSRWGAEFLKLYPQARLFVAGKEHFATGNRQRAMARIASGNYDAVIVSHRSFEFLPVSDKLFRRFVENRSSNWRKRFVEAKAERATTGASSRNWRKPRSGSSRSSSSAPTGKRRTTRITFEELGVDQIFVDEADVYKNLFYTTKMSRIAGLPNSDSNRAFDMYMKTRYIRRDERRARRRLRHRHADLEHHGRDVHDAALSRPGSAEGAGRRAFRCLGGEFRRGRNVARTCPGRLGIPDAHAVRASSSICRNCCRCSARSRTCRPPTCSICRARRWRAASRGIAAAPACDGLKAYIKTLMERAERLRRERVDPSVDNMLKITGDGRKAALDMRLVDSLAGCGRRHKAWPGHRTHL